MHRPGTKPARVNSVVGLAGTITKTEQAINQGKLWLGNVGLIPAELNSRRRGRDLVNFWLDAGGGTW